jgi:DNA-binding NarL/FixJ family response regulator
MALRLLIVDDSDHFLVAARGLLEREGLDVLALASTSAEAIRSARELRPDVTLVDIDLGNESGLDLARDLMEAAGPARVVRISAYPEADLLDLIEASPAVGFLSKSRLSARAIHKLLDEAGGDQQAGEVRAAEAMVPDGSDELRAHLAHTAEGLAGAVEDLQEFSRGIHPAILSKGGLGAALKALARRSAVPVDLVVSLDRSLPERVEVAVYYVVSEALTNAAKHADASLVRVDLGSSDGVVTLTVSDDGVGGADPGGGSGLVGLLDRVEAAGGRMEVTSPPGGGTSLLVTAPLDRA